MEEQDWFRNEIKRSEYPYLSLSGPEGMELVVFTGPPEKGISNFSTDKVQKVEWRFVVKHYDRKDGQYVGDKMITESSDNFLAQVTKISNRGKRWNFPVLVQWKKVKGNKREFKDFTMEEIDASFIQEVS